MQTKIEFVLNDKGRDVWAVSPASTAHDAVQLMADKRVEALLVLSDEKLVGIVTERDCARHVHLKGKRAAEVPVSEVMSSPVVFVSANHTVGDCMRIVTEKGFSHLPVVDGDRVVGIVSIGDLVKSIVRAQDTTIGDLEAYITGKYPG